MHSDRRKRFGVGTENSVLDIAIDVQVEIPSKQGHI